MIKNIEAYDMVMDYLTQNETWKEEEVPGNLRDERLSSKYQNQCGPTPSQAWRNFYTNSYGHVIPA